MGTGVALYLGKTGHFEKRYEFDAADDASAIRHARQYVITSAVEVWQLGRLVGTLTPDDVA